MMRCWTRFLLISVFSLNMSAPSNAKEEAPFSSCADAETFAELNNSLCKTIAVPLSYEANMGEVSIFVRQYPARQKARGNIWFLAGGPGESGATFLAHIELFREIFPNHNLLIPDHRGTGFSSKLCEPEETAESPAGLALEGVEWRSCFGSIFENIERAHQFTRQNAAQDIITLIAKSAPVEETFIYGVSYGTSLALEVGKIAGDVLDGLILDSLTASYEDKEFGISYHSFNADHVGTALLNRCAENVNCPGGPQLLQNYKAFLSDNEGQEISGVELRQYLGSLLDIPHARTLIPAIIDTLIRGDEKVQQLVTQANAYTASYYREVLKFPQSPGSIPLVALISGSEDDARPSLTMEELEKEHQSLGFTSAVPRHLVSNSLPLYATSPSMQNQSLPPIFVMHGSLDPKTPYEGAKKHVERLGEHRQVQMMTIIDAPHGVFLSSPSCLKDPLQTFIADPLAALPTSCMPDEADLNF